MDQRKTPGGIYGDATIKSCSSTVPRKKNANSDGNLDTSKIECYNVPSFKTDIYGHVYHCVHCENPFYDCTSVKDHLGAVHRDFHYCCEHCGEFFSIYWQLKRHLKRYIYNCEHCDYSSNHYSQYRLHSSRSHNIQMKPRFRSENRFNKVYECDICGYQVLRPHMYKKHMKSVHEKDVDF